jgi:GT2 family glycosyltransferase
VTVVVVSRNRAALLRRCLESLEKSEGRETLQIVVVDNGSSDGSAQLDTDFPQTQFIRLPKNFGLTKAMNIGWRAADAEYVFFLHDDTEVDPGAAVWLAGTLDANPNAAAACPLLVDDAGQPAPQLGTLPPDGQWLAAAPSLGLNEPVEYPRGAALMMRVYVIRAVRQIDERYGQFGGDADLAAQILRASKKILLDPGARVRHHGSGAYSALERADFLLGRAVFMGKYLGFAAGLRARLAAVVGPLLSFRFGELRYTVAGQKIDGTQL